MNGIMNGVMNGASISGEHITYCLRHHFHVAGIQCSLHFGTVGHVGLNKQVQAMNLPWHRGVARRGAGLIVRQKETITFRLWITAHSDGHPAARSPCVPGHGLISGFRVHPSVVPSC